MKTNRHRPRSFASLLLFVAVLIGCLACSVRAAWPVHQLETTTIVSNWLVIGPLPKSEDKDFLSSMGGESNTVFAPSATLEIMDGNHAQVLAVKSVCAKSFGMVDLNEHFDLPKNKTAYAFCWLQSEFDQTAQAFFGTGDAVKVWLNGTLVFEKPGGFFEQSCIPRQHQFSLSLLQGKNRLLIKTENGGGDWGFILEAAVAETAIRITNEIRRLKQLHEFQENELAPEKFIFPPGPFPEIKWRNAELAEAVWGKLELNVRWFDATLHEVNQAAKPGRFAASIEAILPNSQILRRALTVFCVDPGCEAWRDPTALREAWIPSSVIDERVWNEYEEERQRVAAMPFGPFGNQPAAEREAAIVLAGLSEVGPIKRSPDWLDTTAIRDQEFHLLLKRKLFPREPMLFRPPTQIKGPLAPELRHGSPGEAGMDANTAIHLREVSCEWAKSGGQPFVALVARHGVIVFHESFGVSDQPVVLSRRFPLDSITKMLTGMMLAQFVSQGLISIDEPVGKFLSDFPTEGPRVVTLRHCLTHSSGLEGHGAWGGMQNPWMENVGANGLEYLEPGRRVIYNGTGFNIAGRAMEQVAGRNIFRLMHENFFIPIGAAEARLTDLGFTAECSAEDLARIGQLMLNRGSYGSWELFSSETFQQMLPRKASEVCPELPLTDWEYGWGLSWMRDADPDTPGKTILGANTIGHGALSSTVLRVDLSNDLVIAISRAGSGKDCAKYLARFLKVVRESLIEHTGE